MAFAVFSLLNIVVEVSSSAMWSDSLHFSIRDASFSLNKPNFIPTYPMGQLIHKGVQ